VSISKVLMVGLGSIGQRHARNLCSAYEDIELIALRSGKDKRETGLNMREFYNLDEALKEKPLAAVLSNPTSLHIPIALKLAKAGVNLFIEKPLSNNLLGIGSLKKVIKEKNLTVMVGYCLRFHPILKKVNAIIKHEELGKILFARVQGGQYLPDWHPESDYRDSYSAKSNLGGGVLLDLSHELDYVQWFFGEAKDVVANVAKVSDLAIDTEDYAEILLRFKNGISAEIHLDYLQKIPTRTGLIVGKNGSLSFDINSNNLELNSQTETLKISEPFNKDKMYEWEIKHFMDCVWEKKVPIVDLDEGLKSLKIVLAAKESSLRGRRISLSK
jgi:predicted dehydrogenase